MRSRKLLSAVLVLSALGLAWAPSLPVAAQSADVVGTDGQIYVLRTGSYGSLFPSGGLADPAHPALALDVIQSGEGTDRLLVPGTEADEIEESPSALFEDDSGTLFVLWQTNRHYVHSWLNLIEYRDGKWGDPIEITGSPFGWKSSPQLAVTRDSFVTEDEHGTPRTWQRTVVHLIWWEPGAEGASVFYAPVVLIDGVYTGWNPVYALDDLVLAAGHPLGGTNLAVAEAPRLEAGVNGQSVVIAFVPRGGTDLVTVSLELLPGELGALADDVRAQIIEVGHTGGDGGLGRLADKARAQIIEVGARLKVHPGMSSYVATQVYDRILASEPERPIRSIADEVRAQIIEVGARMTGRGFNRLSAASVEQVIELPRDDGGAAGPPDLIRVVQASVRPAPETGDGAHRLHLSRDGKSVVASWREGDSVFYRESRGKDGWSETRRLRLNDELDVEHAHSLLERRADERSASPTE